eukprot:10433894-Alexandrium_andersonii.AAC.1
MLRWPALRSSAAQRAARVAPASAARLKRRRTACHCMSNPRTAASPRGPSRTAHRGARRSRPAAAAYLTTP